MFGVCGSASVQVGHVSVAFGPKVQEEEQAPPKDGEAPTVVKCASDGTVVAGSSRIFTPAEVRERNTRGGL